MVTPMLEIPIDSIESAIAAEQGGAARVELCADLSAGGTTPSAGMVVTARKALRIGLHVMIRPRGGDFCYTDTEFEVMKRDLIAAKQFGADGVVFGVLTKAFAVDVEKMKVLVSIARPMSITFHRAFDCVHDPFSALLDIINLGVERILTSGQQQTAEQGIALIKELVARSSGRIIIMPGCGVTKENVQNIIRETGTSEIHAGSAVMESMEENGGTFFQLRKMRVSEAKVREFHQRMNDQGAVNR